MEENHLIYQTFPVVTLATNQFINVPVVLRYDDTNLIEIIKEEKIGYTTEIPIYHPDGTHLAKVRGTRMYTTNEGEKAGLKIEKYPSLWVCTMNGRTLFEIQQQSGAAFKTTAELYTPDGFFVKYSDSPTPIVLDPKGTSLSVGGVVMRNNTFQGCNIGIWVKSDGSISMGVS